MKTNITISNKISLPAGGLPSGVTRKLEESLILKNPEWLENIKHGRWNGNTPKKLYFIQREEDSLVIPRGFIRQLTGILKYNHVDYAIDDQTRKLPDVSLNFAGTLYPFQTEAANNILSRRFGVLNSPTGSGKTTMGLYAIAQRKQPALVVVHSKELMYQWQDRAVQFLRLSPDEIGLIGDGQKTTGARLTIAIVNSLYKCAVEVKNHIGFLVIDECHRTPSRTFTEAVIKFDSRYVLGLSATPYRRDGLSKTIYLFCGDQVHGVPLRELQDMNRVMAATLEVRETKFDYSYADDYADMITALTEDQGRTRLIAQDAIRQATGGNGIALIISDRKAHCEALYALIQKAGVTAKLLTGAVGNGERKKIVEELNNGGVKAVIATSQLIGEGFDLPAFSSIFLSTPIRFSGRLQQCIGRILRTDKDKETATVFDYVDKPRVLQSSFRSRQRAYKEMGILN